MSNNSVENFEPKILEDFNGREIKLQVTYDEDYGVDIDEDTGEVVE